MKDASRCLKVPANVFVILCTVTHIECDNKGSLNINLFWGRYCWFWNSFICTQSVQLWTGGVQTIIRWFYNLFNFEERQQLFVCGLLKCPWFLIHFHKCFVNERLRIGPCPWGKKKSPFFESDLIWKKNKEINGYFMKYCFPHKIYCQLEYCLRM